MKKYDFLNVNTRNLNNLKLAQTTKIGKKLKQIQIDDPNIRMFQEKLMRSRKGNDGNLKVIAES